MCYNRVKEEGYTMYQPGEMIVYGRTGVCRVEGIRREKGQDFYALKPLYQTCDILTPVNGKVFTRPVLTRQEAEALIDCIPEMQVEVCEGKPLRELTEHYQAAIATHDCRDLIELTMSIYAKKKTAEKEKRKFGAVDDRYLKEGEALLFGELAVALDVPVEEVPRFISGRLGKAKPRAKAVAAVEG